MMERKPDRGALWTWSVEAGHIKIRAIDGTLGDLILWASERDLRHMQNALEVHRVAT